MKAIPQDVLRELERAVITQNQLRLSGQIDRKLYEQVNKVIVAAGGKWNSKARCHAFPFAAGPAIEQIILTGGVGPKQELGQFDSPPEVVAAVMELAGIDKTMRVLEPSAGLGALALAAARLTDQLMCVEIDERRAAALVEAGLRSVICVDFLTLEGVGRFDRVIMNPPFARQADIDHVRHAARFVKKGGRLVSVMSAGVRFRENRKTAEFRDWLAERDAEFEDLPAGAFAASGTAISACIVSFDQPEDPR